jgi:hypothetical protein
LNLRWDLEKIRTMMDEQPAVDLQRAGFTEVELEDIRSRLDIPDADEVAARFGDPDESEFWPKLEYRVPVDTKGRWDAVFDELPGDKDWEKIEAMLTMVEAHLDQEGRVFEEDDD